jgi:hypothetical protein
MRPLIAQKAGPFRGRESKEMPSIEETGHGIDGCELLELLGAADKVADVAIGQHPAAVRGDGAMHPDVPAVRG